MSSTFDYNLILSLDYEFAGFLSASVCGILDGFGAACAVVPSDERLLPIPYFSLARPPAAHPVWSNLFILQFIDRI